MKYYKDTNNQIYAYEDNVAEFGSYTEKTQEVPLEKGDENYGVEGHDNDTKTITIQIPNSPTVKEGLIPITEEGARAILTELNKPTKEQVIANNEATIKSLTQEATLEIGTLQDAIDLDMAEDGDADKLKKWRKYRVLLSRVNTTVENMELPEKPD